MNCEAPAPESDEDGDDIFSYPDIPSATTMFKHVCDDDIPKGKKKQFLKLIVPQSIRRRPETPPSTPLTEQEVIEMKRRRLARRDARKRSGDVKIVRFVIPIVEIPKIIRENEYRPSNNNIDTSVCDTNSNEMDVDTDKVKIIYPLISPKDSAPGSVEGNSLLSSLQFNSDHCSTSHYEYHADDDVGLGEVLSSPNVQQFSDVKSGRELNVFNDDLSLPPTLMASLPSLALPPKRKVAGLDTDTLMNETKSSISESTKQQRSNSVSNDDHHSRRRCESINLYAGLRLETKTPTSHPDQDDEMGVERRVSTFGCVSRDDDQDYANSLWSIRHPIGFKIENDKSQSPIIVISPQTVNDENPLPETQRISQGKTDGSSADCQMM